MFEWTSMLTWVCLTYSAVEDAAWGVVMNLPETQRAERMQRVEWLVWLAPHNRWRDCSWRAHTQFDAVEMVARSVTKMRDHLGLRPEDEYEHIATAKAPRLSEDEMVAVLFNEVPDGTNRLDVLRAIRASA